MTTETGIAWGGKVERSINGTTYTSIPEARGLVTPSPTTEYQDVTSLDSPNRTREFVKGLIDPGEITLPCNYTSDGYEQQVADQAAAEAIYYRVTMPALAGQTAGDVFTFRGFVTVAIEANDVGAPIAMTLTIKITGAVSWTKGAGA